MREGWIEKRFDEVFTLQMGKTPDRKNPALFEGNNTWVSIRDLGEKYISSSNECISDEAAANINMVKEGTVIMSFKLTVGKCAIASKDLYTNEAIMAFNVKEEYKIDSSFLYYYLQNYRWEGANKAVMGQTLNKATISKHTICIPSISVQQSIVSELDKINELIRLKKEQLSDYDKLAQSLFYEMFGDPVENEKGWEVKKLGEEYKVSSSKRIMQDEWTTEGVPFLKVSDVVSKINGQNSEPSTFISETTYSKLVDSNAVPVQNDILITSRGTLGLCYIVKNEDRFYFQDGMITWLAECKGNITPLFLTYLFKNHHFLQQITSKANKSTVAYISISQISKRKIPLPPLALQNLFAQRIELIEQQKAEIKSAIADLETLLASRMQYWFFGF